MRQLQVLSFILLLCVLTGCKSSEKKGQREFIIDKDGVKNATISTMNKDAIRIKGQIESVLDTSDKGNTFILKVEEIVKYGPTFATIEPQIGEKVFLFTSPKVRFNSGDEVLMDIKTPLVKSGDMLSVSMLEH